MTAYGTFTVLIWLVMQTLHSLELSSTAVALGLDFYSVGTGGSALPGIKVAGACTTGVGFYTMGVGFFTIGAGALTTGDGALTIGAG